MIDESPCTDPIRAEHNGICAFPQVLFLYPIEYLSPYQSFCCIYPHTCSKLGPYPSFFVFRPSDFIQWSHSIGKECFWLNINFSVGRVRFKGSVVCENFTKFIQCVFSQTALLLDCVHIESKGLLEALSILYFLLFHAFMTLGHCVLTGFPITPPRGSSQNILLEPHPLAPPRVSNWTLWGAEGPMKEQVRRVTQQVKMKDQAKSGR